MIPFYLLWAGVVNWCEEVTNFKMTPTPPIPQCPTQANGEKLTFDPNLASARQWQTCSGTGHHIRHTNTHSATYNRILFNEEHLCKTAHPPVCVVSVPNADLCVRTPHFRVARPFSALGQSTSPRFHAGSINRHYKRQATHINERYQSHFNWTFTTLNTAAVEACLLLNMQISRTFKKSSLCRWHTFFVLHLKYVNLHHLGEQRFLLLRTEEEYKH